MSKDHPIPFEHVQKLSESSLWRFMRAFYDRRGISAWTEGTVPSQITNHSGLALIYARVLASWLDDLVAAGHVRRDQTVYALELGGGTGRLAYATIRHYQRLRESMQLPQLCYVLSDFTESNIDAHRKNKVFRQLVDAGALDFCLFDAANPQVPTLVESRRSLGELLKDSPLAVLANYVFDSLPCDFFRVVRNHLQEGLVSLSSADGKEPEYKHREQIEDVKIDFHYATPARPYYPEPWLEELLDFYALFPSVSFLFPAIGLKCIESLRAMAKNRMLLITGDKASTHIEQLQGNKEPFVAHHGSFSVTANYHALATFARARKAFAFTPPLREGSLTYLVLRFDDREPSSTRLATMCEESFVQQSPTDMHTLAWHVPEGKADVEYYMALIRASAFDPVIVGRIEKHVMPFRNESIAVRTFDEITEIIARSSELYLHLRQDDPYLPAVTRLAVGFKLEKAAATLVERMEALYGLGDHVRALLDKAKTAE